MFPRLYAFVRSRFSREEAVGLYFTVGFLVCALLVIVFGLLANLVFDELRLENLDRWATLAVRQHHSPGLDGLALAVTYFGGHGFLLPATLAVCGILAIRGRRVSAILFAGSVAGGVVLNLLLKLSFARARPDLWEALVTERTYSFPSGHAAIGTVFFGGLAAVVFHVTRKTWVRLLALIGSAAMIVLIAGSRVYLGAHWLSDVAAGLLVGLFWVIVAATGTQFFARRSQITSRKIGPS